jgi:hypothetical protein
MTVTNPPAVWTERYAYLWVSGPHGGLVAEIRDYAHPDMAADYGPVDPPYGWAVYPTGQANPAPTAHGDAATFEAARAAAETVLQNARSDR